MRKGGCCPHVSREPSERLYVALVTRDAGVVRFMMGHAPKGMADHYTLSPAWSLPRLTKIISRVQKWWIR